MTENSDNNNMGTWGTLVGVVGGAALGYWAGRSSGPYGFNYPFAANNFGFANCALNNGGFNSFEAGKTQAELTAGLNYTAQGIGAIRSDIGALSGQMSNGFQRIEDRQFQMLVAENQSLKNELYTSSALCPIKTELAGVNCALGCLKQNQVSAFKAVPLCTTCPSAS